jgi:hypothetical protein
VLVCRYGHPESQRDGVAPVPDFQYLDRIGAEFFSLGRVQQPRWAIDGEGAVDLAGEPVGEHAKDELHFLWLSARERRKNQGP